MKKFTQTFGFVLLLTIGRTAMAGGGATNEVNTDGFRDTPMIPGTKWHLHDPDRPQPPVVTPGPSATLGMAPPSDAEVLFDGKDLAKWQNDRGQAANWLVTNGCLVTGRSGGIRTVGKWADFQLHVEWAAPLPAVGTGQGRGNSGILINNLYEIQVLDSYHALTYPDGQAGAIYGQMPPLVNACLPPGEWQTYDISFESPRWNAAGELVKKAILTVIQNGVVVQDHVELTGCTDGIGAVPWKSRTETPARSLRRIAVPQQAGPVPQSLDPVAAPARKRAGPRHLPLSALGGAAEI